MSDLCRIYCAGSVKAPYDWITSVPVGINRIIFINDGYGGYYNCEEKVPFKKGCLYLIPGNANFIATYSSYESDEIRLDHSYVNFELIPPILSKEVFCLDSFEDDEIRSAVEAFKTFCIACTQKAEFENLSEPSQKFLKSIVLFLVEKIIEKFNLYTVTDKVILDSLKFMHENLNKRLTVEEIAKKFYLSPDGFIRKFKNNIGETPYTYLKKLKVRTAQNMRLSGVKLEEIAEKCGYSDSSALLHAIRKNKKG